MKFNLNHGNKQSSNEELGIILPVLPVNTLDCIELARPTVGYVVRNMNLTPFLREIYEDNHTNIMVVAGRQTFKTTLCSDVIGTYAITHPRHESCYVVDSEAHLSAFSRQRLRNEFFLQNPIPRQFLVHDRGNIGQIALANDHNIYLVTDEGEYKKVEGKSLHKLVLDEMQYQDVEYIQKALYSLWRTHGSFLGLGIGGEAGSAYHKHWLRTDQREWIYDNKLWREELTFDSQGNINNSERSIKGILAGRWVSQKPENSQYRGYHLPQGIYPTTPLTIQDAIHKYHIAPDFSIEHQRRFTPKTIYLSHSEGTFYKADRRPITPDMVQALYVRELDFLTGIEVKELKATFGNEIRVVMGIDWGSGPAASSTVGTIIIHWRKSNRFQIVNVDSRPKEHEYDQAAHFVQQFREYGCDYCVADLGHGMIQVNLMQNGGYTSKGLRIEGLSIGKMMGCWTNSDKARMESTLKLEEDGKGTKIAHLLIDKTNSMQGFIDMVDTFIPHPTRKDETLGRPQIMIPRSPDAEIRFDRRFEDDFCAITRKDLDPMQDVATDDDHRQVSKKEFNHPRDLVMSIIYCLVADHTYDEDRFKVF